MIYDVISAYRQYLGLSPRLDKALHYLAETDFSRLPDGRQEIDGENVFASLQSYNTLPENPTPEAHRKYIDIQYLVEGEEYVAVAPLSAMTGIAEEHPQRDINLYYGPADRLPIGGGRFLLLFPGDAHAPGIAVDGPAPARKCLIKVLA